MEQSAIISLYKEEIDTYRKQVDDLKKRNAEADNNNSILIDKIRQLEHLIEIADVANKDLHTAFDHLREENMRLVSKRKEPEHNEEERNVQALETVQSQYACLARESVSWLSTKEQMNQRIKFLERECERYHRDNTTLGKQVRHLVRTLEEERGMIIRHQNDVDQDEAITCAEDVIDKHLVKFESIEELQKQNQKLLSLLKDMSAREEEREAQLESEQLKVLSTDLQALREELESVKNDRERILTVFNTIHKERDLFKILLSKSRQDHMTPDIFQRMVSVACSAGPAIAAGEYRDESPLEKDSHIQDLRALIKKLEGEVSDLQSKIAAMQARSEEELKLKEELLQKAHTKIIEETKKAEVLHERNEVLEKNMRDLTTEFDEVRTKCLRLTFEADQTKQSFDELKDTNENLERQKQELSERCQRLTYELSHSERTLKLEQEKLARAEARHEELEKELVRYGEVERELVRYRELEKDLARYKDIERELCRFRELEKELARYKDLEKELVRYKDLEKELVRYKEIEKEFARYKEAEKEAARHKDRESELARSEGLEKELAKRQELEKELAKREELERELAKRGQIEKEVAKLRADIMEFQYLRNLEREGRLKLMQELYARTSRPPRGLKRKSAYEPPREDTVDSRPESIPEDEPQMFTETVGDIQMSTEPVEDIQEFTEPDVGIQVFAEPVGGIQTFTETVGGIQTFTETVGDMDGNRNDSSVTCNEPTPGESHQEPTVERQQPTQEHNPIKLKRRNIT